MNQAATAMGSDGASAAQQARLAAQQAQQALAGASDELARERAQQIQRQVARLADRAGELYEQQAAAERQLQQGVKSGTLGEGPRFSLPLGDDSSYGATPQARLTEQKRELSDGVQRLGDQIASAAQQYHAEAPQTSQALNDAARGLADSGTVSRLEIEVQSINEGGASRVVAGDAAVTQALGELRQRLQLAAGEATRAAEAASARPDPVADELARLRALRGRLQQLADAAQLQASGPRGTSGRGGAGAAGVMGATDVASAGRAVAAGAAGVVPLLRAQGADAQQLAQIQRLSRQLGEAAIVTGRAQRLAEQLRGEIDVLDALEAQLIGRGQPQEAIRAAAQDRGAEQYREAVAEYYRQLSRQ